MIFFGFFFADPVEKNPNVSEKTCIFLRKPVVETVEISTVKENGKKETKKICSKVLTDMEFCCIVSNCADEVTAKHTGA